MRSRAVRPENTADAMMEEVPDLAEDISAALERREAVEIMQSLMRDSLDQTESRVMTLHYVHELPLDAVTRMLGLSNQSGAKAYVVSARRKLARAFEQWSSRKQAVKGAGGE